MKEGDLVKIRLQFKEDDVVGTVLSIKPTQPHVTKPTQPGPVYEIKILTDKGIWESWIDQRDYAEVLAKSPTFK